MLRLHLKPPELGALRVEIDIKDGVLKLDMMAENQSAKDLLLSNVPELKDALIEQGIKLEKLDVQIHYGFNQTLANSKEWSRQGKPSNRKTEEGPGLENNETQISLSESDGSISDNYRVNLVA